MDMATVHSAFSGLKSAFDLAKSALQLTSISDMKTRIGEIQDVLFEAQTRALEAVAAQSALIEEVRTLKEQITQIEAWESQKQRYQLTAPWKSAILVYALKAAVANGEPPHWLCTQCYENRVRAILQPRLPARNGPMQPVMQILVACPNCHEEFHLQASRIPVAKYAEQYVSETDSSLA